MVTFDRAIISDALRESGVMHLPSAALWDLNGWMDELRITKGVARYASDSGFTVPTAAYPRS